MEGVTFVLWSQLWVSALCMPLKDMVCGPVELHGVQSQAPPPGV